MDEWQRRVDASGVQPADARAGIVVSKLVDTLVAGDGLQTLTHSMNTLSVDPKPPKEKRRFLGFVL